MERTQSRYEVISIDDTKNIHYELSVVPGSYIARHWHNAIEIISILEGSLIVNVEQQRYELTAGQCILLNANVIHSTTSISGNTAILVQIPIEYLLKYIPDVRKRQFIWDPMTTNPIELTKIEHVKEALNQMRILDEVKPDGYQLRFHSVLFELFYQLYHNFSIPMMSSSVTTKQMDQIERIGSVFQYTEQHYQNPITLEEIAGEMHLQVNYFCRFFKKVTGITYLTFLNEYRISKIYHDLIVTDLPIKDLLEMHGFTNYKLFRKMFYEQFHMTPGQLRSSLSKK